MSLGPIRIPHFSFIELGFALILLVLLFVIVVLLLPFRPVTIYEVSVEPERVCAGDPVTVSVDREVEESLVGLDTITVAGYWIDEGGKPVNGTTATVPLEPHERGWVESANLNQAPIEEGDYYVGATAIARGSVLFVPNTQRVVYQAENKAEVVDC